MRLIPDLHQGSKEWLLYRQPRMGATDFATLCAQKGLSKGFSSLKQSIKEKVLQIKKTNIYMDYGTKMEPILRQQANLYYNMNFVDAQVECDKSDDTRIMASLDGLDLDARTILEIKTSSKEIDAWLSTSYIFYQYQLIHQMYCVGVEHIDTIILYGEISGKICEIQHSTQELIDLMSEDVWLSYCHEYLDILDDMTNKLLGGKNENA